MGELEIQFSKQGFSITLRPMNGSLEPSYHTSWHSCYKYSESEATRRRWSFNLANGIPWTIPALLHPCMTARGVFLACLSDLSNSLWFSDLNLGTAEPDRHRSSPSVHFHHSFFQKGKHLTCFPCNLLLLPLFWGWLLGRSFNSTSCLWGQK